MDSFFGIGSAELVMIVILATIVLGPQRMRQAARQLGQFVAKMQKISRQFQSQINNELDAMELGSIKETLGEVETLRTEMHELRRELLQSRSDLKELAVETEKTAVAAVDAAKKPNEPIPENKIAPPLPAALPIPDDPDA